MNNSKILAFIASLTLFSLLVGCESVSNTNNNTNTNVVVSNVNTRLNANANSSANANRRTVNANLSREEYEKDKETLVKDAKSMGRTIGSGANDGWLWTKTRAVLATTEDLRDSTINIDVDNAVVTLSGTVATQAQKTRAAKVAQSVEGVKNVKNNLTVSANP